MGVLVDSCVWSLALRRRAPSQIHQDALHRLIVATEVRMIGPIRQECLSGISDPKYYAALRDRLRAIADITLHRDDHELAASFFNTCRAKGIQGAHTDFLICAVANRLHLGIYTTDDDFDRYSRHIPIRRFKPQ